MDDLPDNAEPQAVGHDAVTMAFAAIWGGTVAATPQGDMLIAGAVAMLFGMIIFVENRYLGKRVGRYALLRLISGIGVLSFLLRSYMSITPLPGV